MNGLSLLRIWSTNLLTRCCLTAALFKFLLITSKRGTCAIQDQADQPCLRLVKTLAFVRHADVRSTLSKFSPRVQSLRAVTCSGSHWNAQKTGAFFWKTKHPGLRPKKMPKARLQRDVSYQCERPLDRVPHREASIAFGINLFIEEVLPKDATLSVLFSDGVGAHKLKLLLGKLVKLVLHFPDDGLLQLGRRLLGGGLFFAGLSQVRPFPFNQNLK